MRLGTRFNVVHLVLACVCSLCCGGTQLVCREQGAREQCVTTGGPEAAIVTGAAAGAIWATAGGCKVAGCQPPLECNLDTELCQPMRCGEDLGGCPPAYHCDSKTRTCR